MEPPIFPPGVWVKNLPIARLRVLVESLDSGPFARPRKIATDLAERDPGRRRANTHHRGRR